MLIMEGGLKPWPDAWADHYCFHVPAAIRSIVRIAFIGENDQQSVFLEDGARDQRGNVGLQPGIGLGEASVMGIVKLVGNDEGKLRQGVVGEVRREMREWYQVHFLHRASGDV